MENIYACYVNRIGKNVDGMFIYNILFTDSPEDVFCEGWSEKPACNVSNDVLTPDRELYNYIAEVVTSIPLDLAQDNCCFSMQDCRDGIIALAGENLDEAEEYPDEGRIVIHFGDDFEEIEDMLSKREIKMRFI